MSYGFTAGEIAGSLAVSHPPPVTMGCWVKYDDHVAGDVALMWGVSPTSINESYNLVTSGTDDYNAGSYDATPTISSATYTATAGTYDGVWHPVICVFESATSRKIYVNARANTASNAVSRIVGDVNDVTIGRRNDTAQAWIKQIAEVFFYDGTLSDADIDLFMAAARPTQFAGAANVLGYYSLSADNSGTGNHADESGNGGPTLVEAGTLAFNADHPIFTPRLGARLSSFRSQPMIRGPF